MEEAIVRLLALADEKQIRVIWHFLNAYLR